MAKAPPESGLESLRSNTLVNVGGHLSRLVVGLLMPRLIDLELGQVALGVWDLAWSIVTSFLLLRIGLTGAINPFVARYQMARDPAMINVVASSAACCLLVAGAAVMVLTVSVAGMLPVVLDAQYQGQLATVQWLVFLFGTGIALFIGMGTYPGVVTGCHRWDIQNSIEICGDLATLGGMLLALQLGFGLTALALVHTFFAAVKMLAYRIAARRTLPSLEVRFRHARWSQARELLRFGSKQFVPESANLGVSQLTRLTVGLSLGPAMLAVFARPLGILQFVTVFGARLCMALVPTVSSLRESKSDDAVRELFLAASRYMVFFGLPVTLLLSIQGDNILVLWMGPGYEAGALIAILAVGQLIPLSQRVTYDVLKGLNAHGRPGLARTFGAGVAAVLLIGGVSFLELGLTGIALVIVIPPAIVEAFYLPAYACQRLGLPLKRYLLSTWRDPVLCSLPFALCLVLARVLLEGRPLASLGSAVLFGGMVLSWAYWQYALPTPWKVALRARVLGVVAATGSGR